MEASKLQQALDEILKKCKDAGHRLHVFKEEDIELETVVGESTSAGCLVLLSTGTRTRVQ